MTELRMELGTLLATSAGDGLYARGVRVTVPLRLSARVETETVERDEQGRVTFACCVFSAAFDPSHWDTARLGDMYTDSGISNAVNAHLRGLGYSATVGWSEAGRQENTAADFDMDYALIDEFWPELVTACAPPAPRSP